MSARCVLQSSICVLGVFCLHESLDPSCVMSTRVQQCSIAAVLLYKVLLYPIARLKPTIPRPFVRRDAVLVHTMYLVTIKSVRHTTCSVKMAAADTTFICVSCVPQGGRRVVDFHCTRFEYFPNPKVRKVYILYTRNLLPVLYEAIVTSGRPVVLLNRALVNRCHPCTRANHSILCRDGSVRIVG